MTDKTPQDGDSVKNEVEKEESPGSQATPEVKTEGEGESQSDWWAEAQKRGFKDQSDVWSSYKEAEKGLSQKGEELATAKKFEEQVAPVLEAIWADPELLETVKKKLGGETSEESSKKSDDKKPENVPVDREARGFLQLQAIDRFEEVRGLSRLDDETRKEIRGKIGSKLREWGKDFSSIRLEQIPGILEDAFIAVAAKDEKLKTIVSEGVGKAAPGGEMSSMSSGGGESGEEVTLTEAQRKVAEKMPGGIEAYKKGLKKLLSRRE